MQTIQSLRERLSPASPARRVLVTVVMLACFLGVVVPVQAASPNQSAKTAAATDTPVQTDAASSPVLPVYSFEKFLKSGAAAGEKMSNLFKLMGEWNYRAAFWASPDDKPKWTKGVFRNEMILDGRFLLSNVVGDLNIGGNYTIFRGQGLIGYDNTKKLFTSVWADTLSTSLMTGKGNYDPKTKIITETGEFTNPLTGTLAEFRSTLEFTGDDDYKRTVFLVDKSGKETKLIEFDCSKSPSNDVWTPPGDKEPANDSKKP